MAVFVFHISISSFLIKIVSSRVVVVVVVVFIILLGKSLQTLPSFYREP